MKKVIAVFLAFAVMALGTLSMNSSVSFAQTQQSDLQQLNCPVCKQGEVDLPKGTPQEQNQAKALIYGSKEFKKTKKEIQANDGKLLKNKTIIYILDNKQGVITFPVKDAKNGLTTVNYFFDLNKKEIGLEQKLYFKEIGEKLGQFKWVLNNKTFVDVKFNEDGNFILDDGREISPQEYFKEKQEELSSDVSTQASACEWAVGLLCAAGSISLCTGLCVAGGAVANIIGVTACNWACGMLVGGATCIGVTDAICG